MSTNPLRKLGEAGQSVWLDNLSRRLLQTGELQRWIEEEGITGITSNPTIFQKAIAGSADYDGSLRNLLQQGVREEEDLFFGLALEDISRAADLLWPVYEKTRGRDGFVSMEVSPTLAYDSQGTVAEARKLFSALGKKNVLIKIPATRQGIPAIEKLTEEGVNVNVTLLFGVRRYEEAADAYVRGLEKRASLGQTIRDINSVASFFVSRVDTLTDKLLEARLVSAPPEAKKKIQRMLGQAAVSNAKIAYEKYRDLFAGKRFQALPGARVQKILWASTGTKNPRYSDIKYVEELIAPGSVNTLPEATLRAFKDHGQVRVTIEDQWEEAAQMPAELASLDIDLGKITTQLEEEGVKLFSDSFSLLLQEIRGKRDAFLNRQV